MKIPQNICDLLAYHKIEVEKLICFAECDRTLEGEFNQTYLVFCKENLHIIRNKRIMLHKDFKGYFAKSKNNPVKFEDELFEIETLKVSDVEKLIVVNLIASGLVIIKTTEEKAICAFTNSKMHEVSHFVELFNKLREKGELTDDDLQTDDEEETCPKCGMVFPDPARKVCLKCMKKTAIFLRLLKQTSKYKWSMIFIVFFMILNSILGLAVPYIQGHVLYDWALKDKTDYYNRILIVVVCILFFRLFSLISGVIFGVLNAKVSANIMRNLKTNVFSSMQRLSLSFFKKRQTGQLMTRVNNDAADVQHFLIDGLPYMFVNILNVVGIVIILLIMNWQLTLLCFTPLPFLVLFAMRNWPKFYNMSWIQNIRASKLTSLVSDSFKGTKVVKAFGKEDSEKKRFSKASESLFDIQKDHDQFINYMFPVMSLIMQIGGFIIWTVGGLQVMNGGLSFGTLMTFIGYIFMAFGPIQFFSTMVDWWSNCMTAAQRIFEISDTLPEITEKQDAIHIARFKGDLEIENISFGYEPIKSVIKDVNVSAKAGQMIGIVGHSGAGKSTLVNLITRLYDVEQGAIKIDGVDVRNLKISDMRRNIGVVSQEVYIFMGTVAENIAYANPNCSLEDIIKASKIANAHDFIEKLPAGYDTIIGSSGQDLSGGEKQRISIARAVLLNPQILILDEATASLDTQTERKIQEALEILIKGRTTIAIAHRLSTLRNADFLVVMENGKVVETGTHFELIKNKNIYFRLFQKQNEALSLNSIEE
jgi:ATP-binding cassette subfamily B protein